MGMERRNSKDIETKAATILEDVANSQRRISAELRGEMKAALKQEQSSVAALDEQLWLTDQRLGQRIDDMTQSCSMRERTLAANTIAELATAARSDRAAAVAAIAEMATSGQRTSPLRGPCAASNFREPVSEPSFQTTRTIH